MLSTNNITCIDNEREYGREIYERESMSVNELNGAKELYGANEFQRKKQVTINKLQRNAAPIVLIIP